MIHLTNLLAKHLWELVAVVVLILIPISLILRRRHRRGRANVRGLAAILRRDGQQVGAELKAPARWADTFRFVIRDEAGRTARLDYPRPDDAVYVARLRANGQVNVVTPAGEKYTIAVGGTGEPLPSGLRLAFRDRRYRAAGTRDLPQVFSGRLPMAASVRPTRRPLGTYWAGART